MCVRVRVCGCECECECMRVRENMCVCLCVSLSGSSWLNRILVVSAAISITQVLPDLFRLCSYSVCGTCV